MRNIFVKEKHRIRGEISASIGIGDSGASVTRSRIIQVHLQIIQSGWGDRSSDENEKGRPYV